MSFYLSKLENGQMYMELSFQFKSHRNEKYQPNSQVSVGAKRLKVKQQYLFVEFLAGLNSFSRDK